MDKFLVSISGKHTPKRCRKSRHFHARVLLIDKKVFSLDEAIKLSKKKLMEIYNPDSAYMVINEAKEDDGILTVLLTPHKNSRLNLLTEKE